MIALVSSFKSSGGRLTFDIDVRTPKGIISFVAKNDRMTITTFGRITHQEAFRVGTEELDRYFTEQGIPRDLRISFWLNCNGGY